MNQNHNGAVSPPSSQEDTKETGFDVTKWTVIAAGAAAGVILIIFLIGVVLALLPNIGATAARVKTVRDLFIIVMGLESILIIFAIAALIIQIARLTNLLQNEVKPILKNTQDTVNTAKGTAQFVSANLTEPLIKASAFMAGVGVFVREWGGIRKALRRSTPARPTEEAHPNGRS